MYHMRNKQAFYWVPGPVWILLQLGGRSNLGYNQTPPKCRLLPSFASLMSENLTFLSVLFDDDGVWKHLTCATLNLLWNWKSFGPIYSCIQKSLQYSYRFESLYLQTCLKNFITVLPFCYNWFLASNKNKTGVIDDPLGQIHSHASSEHCFSFVLFLKIWNVGTDGRVTCASENNDP